MIMIIIRILIITRIRISIMMLIIIIHIIIVILMIITKMIIIIIRIINNSKNNKMYDNNNIDPWWSVLQSSCVSTLKRIWEFVFNALGGGGGIGCWGFLKDHYGISRGKYGIQEHRISGFLDYMTLGSQEVSRDSWNKVSYILVHSIV